ncbi:MULTISPECIES: hypothetical protein [Acinetobacter Taxon 24D]|uniref:hypothetical protein n=1 Tax=Acinetobacter Taxon 24D TaxID=2839057 RepID=UPI001BE46D53|nr:MULTISPECIES: hypothetical protein [Acinetobacter Taxon 24D]
MLGNSGKYALVDGRWLHVRQVRALIQAPAAKPAETANTQKPGTKNFTYGLTVEVTE